MSDSSKQPVRFVSVLAEEAGQRLDNFLLRHAGDVPKTRLYRAIRKGEVRVNKGRSKADYRVKADDSVRVPPLTVVSRELSKQPSAAWEKRILGAIMYDDSELLVINKPTGLAVHGGSGVRLGLIESLRSLLPDERYLELVHRLDRETSGCLLVARRPSALRRLHQQLRDQDKGLQKRYLALVAGKWPQYLVDVEAPLEKFERGGERIVQVTERGKPSHTRIRPLEVLDGCTLVEAEPVTGRTHQIRVHASYYKHAVLGDTKYQHDDSRDQWRQRGINGLCLHSRSIGFQAATGHQVTVVAPIPNPMHRFLVDAGCDPDIY